MSLYICPKCGIKSFTWAIEDEPYIKTNWGCFTCNYLALEDEKLMRICNVCEQKSESPLIDVDREYWGALLVIKKTNTNIQN